MADALLRELDDRGFVVIEGALSAAELEIVNGGIDRDLLARPDAWPVRTGGTRQSTKVLRPLPGADASPFDHLIHHKSALPLLRSAYQDDIAFSEMSVIVKDGAGAQVRSPKLTVALSQSFAQSNSVPYVWAPRLAESVLLSLCPRTLDGTTTGTTLSAEPRSCRAL